MSKVKLKFVQVHAPLFVAGKNFGEKIKAEQTKGVALMFDDAKGRLFVEYNGEIAVVPEPSVLSMIAEKHSDWQYEMKYPKAEPLKPVENISHPSVVGNFKTAQVSDAQQVGAQRKNGKA
jgi:hypothetical protein